MSLHYIEKCRQCRQITAQCRCPAEDKTIKWIRSTECPFCQAHRTVNHVPYDQDKEL